MAGSWPGDFGGLCGNGHDVPVGASYCPSCGAPTFAPTDPPTFAPAGPAPVNPPAPAPTWDPANDPNSPWARRGWRAPPEPPVSPWDPGPGYQWGSGGQWGSGSQWGPGGQWGLRGQGAPPPVPWGPPGGPSSGPPRGYPYAPARSTNGLAIASMVLGILWIYWIGSILAVIFGHIALRQTRESGEQGRGMAIAGLVLGYVGLTTAIVVIIALAVSAGT